jgi:ribosome-associated protein
MSAELEIAPGLSIPARELAFRAVRAGGPGGQNVNKVSTKVELRFELDRNTTLSPPVKARFRAQNAARFDAEGRVLIVCDDTRSQAMNLELARERLAELVRRALVAPKRRRPTKPSVGARKARLENKKKRSETKQSRRGRWE